MVPLYGSEAAARKESRERMRCSEESRWIIVLLSQSALTADRGIVPEGWLPCFGVRRGLGDCGMDANRLHATSPCRTCVVPGAL